MAEMFKGWMQIEGKDIQKSVEEMSKKGRRHIFNDWVPRGDKHVYVAGQFFLTADASGKGKAVAGLVFDADYLRDQLFPETLDQVLMHQEEKGEKNHVAMMIRPKYDMAPIVTS